MAMWHVAMCGFMRGRLWVGFYHDYADHDHAGPLWVVLLLGHWIIYTDTKPKLQRAAICCSLALATSGAA
jgi:hypothetical protein